MGIVDPIREMIAKLTTLNVVNGQGQTVPLFARVWNNQFAQEALGEYDPFPRPCAFVEIMKGGSGDSGLGEGFAGYDVTWRIHLSHELYDAGDGTMDQDLGIFDLKDHVIDLLTYFEMVYCSGLMCIHEEQDFNHSNIYHYIVDFKCHFIEVAGDQTTADIDSVPPVLLEIDAQFTDTITE
ncbi:MAG: hypothetical protein JWO03_3867 [Bacteroidetes bacterium]|nr:hypothetical protein [Bacteroidota bacterium]